MNCPLKKWCRAFAEGTQGRIPAPKKAKATPTFHCAAVVARDSKGRLLLEQRPAQGMWANMWQCPTLEKASAIGVAEVRAFAQMRSLDPVSVRKVGAFTHQTTHRRMEFVVYVAEPVACRTKKSVMRWVSEEGLVEVGVSNAQRKVIACASAIATQ